MEIYRRIYDNCKKQDGTPKNNEYLGSYEILEIINNDFYDSERIGLRNNKVYLITEREVLGYNGGSIFKIKELKTLTSKLNK